MKKYRSTRHATFDICMHIVFVTKYRAKVLTAEHINTMSAALTRVSLPHGVRVIEFNGEEDHVHLIVSIPPRVAISDYVNVAKSVTSRILRKKFQVFSDKLWGRNVAVWSRSYFVASVGEVDADAISHYIREQKRPD